MIKRLAILLAALLIPALSQAQNLTLYVSGSGADNDSCTSALSPCATFANLATISRGYGPGVRIYASGTLTDAFSPDSGGTGWSADSALVLIGSMCADSSEIYLSTATPCDTLPWGYFGKATYSGGAIWDVDGTAGVHFSGLHDSLTWVIRCGRANCDSASGSVVINASGTDVSLSKPYTIVKGIQAKTWSMRSGSAAFDAGAYRDSLYRNTITGSLDATGSNECVVYRNRIRYYITDSTAAGTAVIICDKNSSQNHGIVVRRNRIDLSGMGSVPQDGSGQVIIMFRGSHKAEYTGWDAVFDSNLVQGGFHDDAGTGDEHRMIYLGNEISGFKFKDNRWDIRNWDNDDRLFNALWIRDSTGYFGNVSFERDTFLLGDRDTSRTGIYMEPARNGTGETFLNNVSFNDCIIRGAAGDYFLRFQDKFNNYAFTGNIIYNATGPAITLEGGLPIQNLQFYNNTVVGEPALNLDSNGAPQFSSLGPRSQFKNNLFVNFEVDTTSSSKSQSVIKINSGWSGANVTFDNNIYWNKGIGSTGGPSKNKVIKQFASIKSESFSCVGKSSQGCIGFWGDNLSQDWNSYYIDPQFSTLANDAFYGDVSCVSPVASLNIADPLIAPYVGAKTPGSTAGYYAVAPPREFLRRASIDIVGGHVLSPLYIWGPLMYIQLGSVDARSTSGMTGYQAGLDTSSVASTSITLKWQMPPGASFGSAAFTYDLRYSLGQIPDFIPFGVGGAGTAVDMSSVSVTPAAPNEITVQITGLTASSSYGFRMFIRDVCGTVLPLDATGYYTTDD